ncbi:uncharacterized protein EDB93DRAFT_1119007 [Suillus bovinus]|uniref:uncharacterized protein n=1 Tax=Suillus bovinus TaxID=48563 RepID=UPI001B869E58|nr:uncharacterized protein EDB93DRAFT_1119007 [Suillus bovinus]KAG2158582.1 hypothetical protein EDB93DRAFT_1119007 [Suillus bovinus]
MSARHHPQLLHRPYCGEAFAFANPTQLIGSTTTVVWEILVVCDLLTDRLDNKKVFKADGHEVEYGDEQYQISDRLLDV